MSALRNNLSEKSTQDQETLRLHREMYERRLRDIERANGKSDRELVNTANNPAMFRNPTTPKSAED